MNDILFAFLITLAAGMFTGVGGLIALFSKRNNLNFLSKALSFSAGVMIYISFVEIFSKALESLSQTHTEDSGFLITTVAFFAGVLLIAIIDKFIPEPSGTDNNRLNRIGAVSALSIAIHNFPEGLITFMATLHDPGLGLAIGVAIALHNIPEGVAIAAPIFYATGSKKRAVLAALGSGATEPLGAVAAYFLLSHTLNDSAFGVIFAAVGGIMVYIAMHQLFPAALKYGKQGTALRWLFFGMFVMAFSLILL